MNPPRFIDSVWSVMTAASDFNDEPVIEICRRVIDARLRGETPRVADVESIEGYWTT